MKQLKKYIHQDHLRSVHDDVAKRLKRQPKVGELRHALYLKAQDNQMYRARFNVAYNLVGHQVNSQVFDQVYSQVRGQVRAQVMRLTV